MESGPTRTGSELHWADEDLAARQVRQRHFYVTRLHGGAKRWIPGLIWTPQGPDLPGASRPLVLIGHGGSGNKRQDYVISLARRLVQRLGFAVAAIDGPVHGEGRLIVGKDGGDRIEDEPGTGAATGGDTLLQFAQMWASDPDMTDAMVADWLAVIDRLLELPDVADGPVGYWGLSMGTILGLPLVASEPRISAAVLGLMGLTGPTRDRIAADAPRVSVPVLFVMNWDDELFPRHSALALFDAIGAAGQAGPGRRPDKRLHAHPGGHGELGEEVFEDSEAFFATRLGRRGT